MRKRRQEREAKEKADLEAHRVRFRESLERSTRAMLWEDGTPYPGGPVSRVRDFLEPMPVDHDIVGQVLETAQRFGWTPPKGST